MDAKIIIYLIIGIVYFLYTIGKKVEEKKKDASPNGSKPVSPPSHDPLKEITRELQRRKAEMEETKRRQQQQQQQKRPAPKPVTQTKQPTTKGREILVTEKPKPAFIEGQSSFEPLYERPLTDEDKIKRGDVKLVNEGVYKTESIEEMEIREGEEFKEGTYVFNAREAFIGSLIFERKF